MVETWVQAAWTAVALLLGFVLFVYPRVYGGNGGARRLGRRDAAFLAEEAARLERRKGAIAANLASFMHNGGEAMVREHAESVAAEKAARDAQIAEERSFREAQELEFEAAAAQDKQRLQARREAQKAKAAAAEAAAAVAEAAELERALSLSVELDGEARAKQREAARLRRRARFEAEPEAVQEPGGGPVTCVRLCVRLPNGRRLQRCWALSARVGEIYAFVDAMRESGELERESNELNDGGAGTGETASNTEVDMESAPPGGFGFTLRTPFPAKAYTERALTLQEAGLTRSETLLVKLDD